MCFERLDLLFGTPLISSRALGTALEWPEAKKKAGQVRQWGIEVCRLCSIRLDRQRNNLEVSDLISNYLPIGAGHEAKNAMPFFGATRYDVLARIVFSGRNSLIHTPL